MFILMVVIFVLGYAAIALEHPLKINKSATALVLAVLLWVVLMLGGPDLLVNTESFKAFLANNVGGDFATWISHHALLEHLGEISEIIFFLLGAMTIVELIDAHEGFRIITDRIKTTRRRNLLWIIAFITFFMSAALDNLTTSIVMTALLRKLIADRKDRWFYAGMVIIAANAGGAWSPIGDVTTIMLWIAGKVTTVNIIIKTLIPSLFSMIIPLLLISLKLKGHVTRPHEDSIMGHGVETKVWERNLIFFIGVGSLLFVPVFKTFTHLPPYLGMLWGLGLLWIITEILHKEKNDSDRTHLAVTGVLRKVDVPSVLFFLGILTAVAALQTAGHLELLASWLNENIGNLYAINLVIGILSSIVDNVPLVAGAIGMYSFEVDHYFWEFLAYCAGTGGSILIIGSAAGVAVMGMEKIDFIWYLKNITIWALVGYFAGGFVYIIQEESGIFHTEQHNEISLNLENKKEVIDYLHMTRFSSQNETSTSELTFHYLLEKGEPQFGYKMTTNDEGIQSWKGGRESTDLALQPYSKDTLSFDVDVMHFLISKDGKLIQKKMCDTIPHRILWNSETIAH